MSFDKNKYRNNSLNLFAYREENHTRTFSQILMSVLILFVNLIDSEILFKGDNIMTFKFLI